MKKSTSPLLMVLTVMMATILSVGHFLQLTQGYTGAPGETACNSCHNNPPPTMSGGAELRGMPAYVVGGQSYPMSMIVYTDNMVGQNAGFQMTILNGNGTSNGQLSDSDPNVSVQSFGNRQYVQHQPGIFFFQGSVWDTVRFHFNWTPANVSQPTSVMSWYAALLGNGNYLAAGGQRLDSTILGSKATTIVPALVADIIEQSAPLCFGDETGSLEVTFSGGLAPVQILWSNGETDNFNNGLAAGLYSVTISDAAGQVIVLQHQLVQPNLLTLSGSAISPSCHDLSDGQLNMVVSGGTMPYLVELNGNPTNLPVTGLGPGQYQLQVTDANNCATEPTFFELIAPQPIQMEIVVVEPETPSESGLIIIEVTGGTPPYSYLWEGPNQYVSTAQHAVGLSEGTYFLTITDANDCEAYYSVDVDFVSSTLDAGLLSQLSVFPNPGIHFMEISFPESLTPGWDVSVYTPDGIVLWQQVWSQHTPLRYAGVLGWTPGLYLIHVRHRTTGASICKPWIRAHE